MKPWILITGWTLIHFVWQGGLIAVATAAGLRLMRRGSSEARYATACIGLAAMFAAPLITATSLWTSGTGLVRVENAREADPAAEPANVPAMPAETASAFPSGAAAMPGLDPWLSYIVSAWLAGVVVLMGRFAGGCWRLHRLQVAFAREAVSRWQSVSEEIARRLRVPVAFRVVESSAVDAPSAIGWIRPVIVLPVAAMANLAPAQIEAILAHELAHVRRHDYGVNLLQTLVETLLFYHPGVWWVSARVREAREHCCDDAAVGVCGERTAYAAALAELASWRSRQTVLTVGATDGSLLARIRRLLGTPHDDEPRSLSGLVTLALAGLLFAGVVLQSAPGVEGTGAVSPQHGPDWRVLSTDHFELHYHSDLHPYVERIAPEAERAYERISSDLRHNLAFKVPIVLFRNENELRQNVKGGRSPEPHADAFADPSHERILLAADGPAAQRYGVITHELAHVFGFDIIPGTATPRWILEGLAEYEREAWDARDLAAVRDAVRADGVPTIAALDSGSGMDERVSAGFGRAAFEFVEARWGKSGVRQFIFGLRQAALTGGDPYQLGLRTPKEEFSRALEQYLKERFSGL